LDRISKAMNLEPHKGVVLINKKNALVIDIRSQKEFDEGKISQAKHLGPDLESCKKEILKVEGRPVILVCQNGTNSSRMASDLKKAEISVFVLKGGINNWVSEKLPLIN
jgi:rhodanese-related sulfurtransferase